MNYVVEHLKCALKKDASECVTNCYRCRWVRKTWIPILSVNCSMAIFRNLHQRLYGKATEKKQTNGHMQQCCLARSQS